MRILSGLHNLACNPITMHIRRLNWSKLMNKKSGYFQLALNDGEEKSKSANFRVFLEKRK